MLQRMRFVHKVTLMPLVAGVGFLAIFAVALMVDLRNARILARIGGGHVPAVSTTLQLDRTLGDLQRSLQDAVAARDSTFLEEADRHRDLFLQGLKEAEANETLRPEQIRELRSVFSRYFSLARDTSLQMIGQETGLDFSATLQKMSADYNDIRQRLASLTSESRRGMQSAFDEARANQRSAVVYRPGHSPFCSRAGGDLFRHPALSGPAAEGSGGGRSAPGER